MGRLPFAAAACRGQACGDMENQEIRTALVGYRLKYELDYSSLIKVSDPY